jgi:hypothetical protein
MEKSKLQELLEDEFQCRSYSGRAMYGASCLAVTLDDGPGHLVATLVEAATREGLSAVEDRALGRALRSWRQDSMGRGIVVYFPGTPYVGDDSDEDDADDDNERNSP